jgi:hypothetical protein
MKTRTKLNPKYESRFYYKRMFFFSSSHSKSTIEYKSYAKWGHSNRHRKYIVVLVYTTMSGSSNVFEDPDKGVDACQLGMWVKSDAVNAMHARR